MRDGDLLNQRNQAKRQATDTETLDLLLPTKLQVDLILAPSERTCLQGLLERFVASLQIEPPRERIRAIRSLVESVKPAMQEARTSRRTEIPASADEVEDFDMYFQVRRVESEDAAWVLVKGLFQTTVGVLSLVERAPRLSKDELDQQIAGFIAYANLLLRMSEAAPAR
ncbi:MAG: hypothetical protein AAGG56_03790 [Pseudomonadota bacterium]